MTWNEVRQHFPEQWLLVEATQAHSKANRRILDQLAVLGSYSSGKTAMDGYLDIHRSMPERELFVLHTSRGALDIEALRWLGIRGVH